MTKTNNCFACGADMVWEKRPNTVRYQGHEATVKVIGWWCDSCGEGILEGKELGVSEHAFFELKAKVDGVLGPAEVALARKAIGMSQREAGRVLGGGVRAFQKYESGETCTSVAMSHLLRILAKNPSLVSQLKDAKRPMRAASVKNTLRRRKANQ